MPCIAAALVSLLFSIIITIPLPTSALSTETTFSHQPLKATAVLHLQRSGTPEAKLTSAQPMTSTSFIFLPMVVHGHDSRPACSPDSPFSLQIAALHQVEPGDGQALRQGSRQALYDGSFRTLTEALDASGACWARLRVDWAKIQPEPPPAPYIWGPYHDEKLRLVTGTGVQLIAHVDGIPDWASDSPCGPIDPDGLDGFVNFLTDLVNRYKEPPWNIHHWELFNEPDGTWPQLADDGMGCWGYHGQSYAQMLAAAYVAIKAADPEATVLMGGLAYEWFTEYGGAFYRYFVDDVMAHGGAEYVDVLNFHYFSDFHREWERWDDPPPPTCGILNDGQGSPYEAGGIDLVAKANHFRNRLDTCFGVEKPIWLTELGEHGRAGNPDSLAQQARYVIQGYARGLAAGIQNITWFALVSPPYDPHEQGLLYEDDWSPKPAFYAYQTLTRELAGYTYSTTLDVPDVEGYVFHKAHGQEQTVAWGSGRLTFAPVGLLRVVDLAGTVIFVHDGGAGDVDGSQNGNVTLQMTADPVFVSRW
ncbi:hypothetical protein ACFLYD_00225 [Chloroflexota bacterium]